MAIQYTFEIVSVDESARCMLIIYRSEGRETMHIGARLPFEGEPLEEVIASYAPTPFWRGKEAAVVVPQTGLTGSLTDTVVPESAEELARARRDRELALSDWSVLPDSPMDPATHAVWVEYRQLLRDVPQQSGFPDNIVWPVSPAQELR